MRGNPSRDLFGERRRFIFLYIGLVPRLSLFCLSAICIAFPALASAQQAPAITPAPYRIAGVGNSHLRITTANPDAQIWFDQGLTLLHDFWDYESVRAFQQSIRLDPQCAMCYWGLYEAERFREYGSPHRGGKD